MLPRSLTIPRRRPYLVTTTLKKASAKSRTFYFLEAGIYKDILENLLIITSTESYTVSPALLSRSFTIKSRLNSSYIYVGTGSKASYPNGSRLGALIR